MATRKLTDEDILARAESILRNRVRDSSTALSDPEVAGRVFQMRLAHLDREHFAVAYLDTKHRIIEINDEFLGTIDGAEVHPRVIAAHALRVNAAAIICAHNHPSNNPEASAADRAVTARLKQALALLDIRLLDHFIVTAGNPPYSMALRGML